MSITSVLPGLWAGCVAAAALAGVALYQQPKPDVGAAPQAVLRSGPIITTLFGKDGALGHIALSLVYTVQEGKPSKAPLIAVASDRLTQAALTRAGEFQAALEDEQAFARFVIASVGTIDGYSIDAVEEASFHPFSGGD